MMIHTISYLRIPYQALPYRSEPEHTRAQRTRPRLTEPHPYHKVEKSLPEDQAYMGGAFRGKIYRLSLGLMDDLYHVLTMAKRDDSGTQRVQSVHYNIGIYFHHVQRRIGVMVARGLGIYVHTMETVNLVIQESQKLPYHTITDLTGSNHIRAHLTTPNLIQRHHTRTHLTLADHSKPQDWWPYHTITTPHPILPHLTLTYRTLPLQTSRLYFKSHHIKAPEPGAIVADATGLASQYQNVLNQFSGNLIIQDFNGEFSLPANFEGWPNTYDAGTVNDAGAYIQIKRLVSIGIQFIRNFITQLDFLRNDKDSSLEQVPVGLTPLTGDFEIHGGFSHCGFKVGSRLIDFTIRVGIEIITPLLGIILRTCNLGTTLAHLLQFGNWKTVLQQWRDTFYLNIDSIHRTIPPYKRSPSPAGGLVIGKLRTLASRGHNWIKQKPPISAVTLANQGYYSTSIRGCQYV